MLRNLWAAMMILLLAGFLLAACGTNAGNGSQPPEDDEEIEAPGESDEAEMDASVNEMTSTVEHLEGDLYRYTVTNETDEAVTFEFTSGQRFDFALINEQGEQEFLMSSVSSFIQAMGEETIEQGGELSYEFEVPPLEDLDAGTYTLEAWLTPSVGESFQAETDHVVE